MYFLLSIVCRYERLGDPWRIGAFLTWLKLPEAAIDCSICFSVHSVDLTFEEKDRSGFWLFWHSDWQQAEVHVDASFVFIKSNSASLDLRSNYSNFGVSIQSFVIVELFFLIKSIALTLKFPFRLSFKPRFYNPSFQTCQCRLLLFPRPTPIDFLFVSGLEGSSRSSPPLGLPL